MESVFKDFPNVDVIYTAGDDYYLSEPKHLGEDVEVKVHFRNEQAKQKFESAKGVFSESELVEKVEALTLELEAAKAENASLTLELEALKTQAAKPKAEK
jgi:hypothetical protein